MKIAINKAHYPVTVLGYGQRIGIWTQGCSIHCKDCISQDTWDSTPDKEIEVEILLQWCQKVGEAGIDGITVSGGEPFKQPEALALFLKGIRKWANELSHPIDILCYTGLSFKDVKKHHGSLLDLMDAVISEPFVHTLPVASLRGSANQNIISLSTLGQERYANIDASHSMTGKRFQVSVDEDHIWFVGIPERGEMQKIETECRKNGVLFNAASWRS